MCKQSEVDLGGSDELLLRFDQGRTPRPGTTSRRLSRTEGLKEYRPMKSCKCRVEFVVVKPFVSTDTVSVVDVIHGMCGSRGVW